jgi:hypothetical protein
MGACGVLLAAEMRAKAKCVQTGWEEYQLEGKNIQKRIEISCFFMYTLLTNQL